MSVDFVVLKLGVFFIDQQYCFDTFSPLTVPYLFEITPNLKLQFSKQKYLMNQKKFIRKNFYSVFQKKIAYINEHSHSLFLLLLFIHSC